MNISIIIPAYNAAQTITATLKSLQAQTVSQWEAVLVNDGSTDETATIVEKIAAEDGRIRLINQSNQGACAARNVGIHQSYHDWLLFLDADDWIAPEHLERMTALLKSDLTLDAVYCDWVRVKSMGEITEGDRFEQEGDLFSVFVHWRPFPPVACIVRRSVVEAAGKWDRSLSTCQDWDFWQRVARTGARFGHISAVLAYYRLRPDSISRNDPHQLLADGLRVLTQGYSFDPRVQNPAIEHQSGQRGPQLRYWELAYACWVATLPLGRGEDARWVLEPIRGTHWPDFDPKIVADNFFRFIPFGLSQSFDIWITLWPKIITHVDAFLQAFEVQTQALDLANQVRKLLELAILQYTLEKRPLTIGHTHAIMVEVTQPITDVTLPAGTKRLHCTCLLEGEQLGSVILDTNAEPIDAATIAEAIAAEFAWPILGRYFEHTLYPHLKVKRQNDHLSIWRGNICLAHDLPDATTDFWLLAHDQIGWELFLQEVWARPRWPQATIYDGQAAKEYMPTCRLPGKKLVVEVSQPLLNVATDENEIEVTIMVGGTKLGRMEMNVSNGRITAHELRAAITTYAGLDLCRLAVREGLIGYSLNQLPSLRVQLARLARQQIERTDFVATILNRLAYCLEWLWQRIDEP